MHQDEPQPESVVVADSEVLIRNALADYLRDCGYKVSEAATADEVVAILEGSRLAPNAILSDVDLGGSMNGFTLGVWVRKHHPEVQFILAGSIDKIAKEAGDLCDRGPHLKRPYDPQAVANHVKQLLAKAQQ